MIKKIVLMVLCSTSAFATTYYVDINSTNATPPYDTPQTAALSIQPAVDQELTRVPERFYTLEISASLTADGWREYFSLGNVDGPFSFSDYNIISNRFYRMTVEWPKEEQ